MVCSVIPNEGSPLFTDGPFVEAKEHLGGFAVAVGWPQEVHCFPHRARAAS